MAQIAVFNTRNMEIFKKIVDAKNPPAPFLYGGIRIPRDFIIAIRSLGNSERLQLKYENRMVLFCNLENRVIAKVSFEHVDEIKSIQFLSLFADHCGFVIDGIKPDTTYQIILEKRKYTSKPEHLCRIR